MHKSIGIASAGAALLLAVACGVSDLPTTSDQQQQDPTAVVLDRAEPTATPQQEVQPRVSDQPEPTQPPKQSSQPKALEEPKQEAEPSTQPEDSAFLMAAGREYPGLLTLPECDSSTQLTMSPLEDDAYAAIIPLGLLSTPQHVLPTSHIYYQLVREPTPSSSYGPPAVAEVRAPGNIRILLIESSESKGGPQGDYIDYEITFAPCRGRMYQLIHVSTLIPELEELFDAGLTGSCDEYGSAQGQYRLCQSVVQLDMPVGTVIGTAGGKVSSALDLEAWDLEGPPLEYANPARFFSEFDLRLKVVCPFDDFTSEIREIQLARVADYDGQPRTAKPLCGEVMQDIPSTAQGNWYAGERGARTNWSQELALVHDNVDPALAAISIGGIVASPGVWLFRPESTGLINRDFSDVSADGRTYCYQGAMTDEGGQTPAPFPGRLLISLTSDTQMLVEQQDGGCADGVAFIDPVTYQR